MNNKSEIFSEKINLSEKLSDDVYIRANKEDVLKAISELNVHPSEDFIQFYTLFAGPFWDENMGIELLDIIDDHNNICSSTYICRNEYGFDDKYLVLSEMNTSEVIVLDSETDKVYRVNFEGGDELLKSGNLSEEWSSFIAFLKEYFNL